MKSFESQSTGSSQSASKELGYEVRIAETKEEIESALSLVYANYVEHGFMDPDPSGIRLTPYHGLASTPVLIALHGGEIIGTLTIIRDGSFGLPIDSILDLKNLRERPHRLAEISCLAIRKDFRKSQFRVLMMLLKYLYQYCDRYYGVDTFVISVNPNHVSFYESVFFFKKIEDRVIPEYDLVKGAPAVGLYLIFPADEAENTTPSQEQLRYRKLRSYFKEESPEFAFPKKPYFSLPYPTMSFDTFRYFFEEKTSLLSKLSEAQSRVLKHFHYKTKPKQLDDALALPTQQQETRFDVYWKAELCTPKNIFDKNVVVLNASRQGLGIFLKTKIEPGAIVRLSVKIGEQLFSMIEGVAIWSSDKGLCGIKIAKACTEWDNFLTFLERELEIIPSLNN